MKKVFYLAVLLPFISFAQDAQPTAEKFKSKHTISANASVSGEMLLGISLEATEEKGHMDFKESGISQLSYATSTLNSSLGRPDITGKGFQVDLGHRTYFNKAKWSGIYLQNSLSFGKIWFKEDVPFSLFTFPQHFSGFYNYFSMFNPDLGYKLATHGFTADLAVGFIWKWELKGKADDIDNRMFDNFAPRVGVKLGYQF